MTSQITKSLRDFAHRAGKLPFHRKRIASVPTIPLTIRVGIAGHLNLPPDDGLAAALRQVLTALRSYAETIDPRYRRALFGDAATAGPELRLVSQLASGFDQLAADTGLPLGYQLHTVLPGARDRIADAVARNVTIPRRLLFGRARAYRAAVKTRFIMLLDASARVIEMDSEGSDGFSPADYAQAGSVILDHSDLLVVALHPAAEARPGGTLSLAHRAEERGLPIVRLTLGAIGDSDLSWTADGRRQRCRLFDANLGDISATVFGTVLDDRMIAADAVPPTAGWFERRYTAQLELWFNDRLWHKRWHVADIDADADGHPPVLSRARDAIDRDFAPARIWLDNRASAFAELLRGSFHASALLGLLAIGGAAAGLFAHAYSIPGKLVEIASLSVILFLAHRSHRHRWRSQWLRLRQIERLIDRAAWLGLLGRSSGRLVPADAAGDDGDALERWAQAYAQAVIRAASFPTVRLTPDYRIAAQMLLARNLVAGQMAYFADESDVQQRAHDALTRAMTGAVVVATGAVLTYLAVSLFVAVDASLFGATWAAAHDPRLSTLAHRLGTTAAWLGILLPALAATLAAMRSFGEYEQLAARYRGMHGRLETVLAFLRGRLPDITTDPGGAPLSSAVLTRKTLEVTDALAAETSGWGALFQGKDIEIV